MNPLKDVHKDDTFLVKEGPTLRNLYQLQKELKRMSDDQFDHHVNESKNDFYNWVYHVVKDTKLAQAIAKTRTKSAMAQVVGKRIQQLEGATKERKEKSLDQTISTLKAIASQPIVRDPILQAPEKHVREASHILDTSGEVPKLPTLQDIEARIKAKLEPQMSVIDEKARSPDLSAFRTTTPTPPASALYKSKQSTIDAEDTQEPKLETITFTHVHDLHRHMIPYALGLMAGILAGLVIARFFI